MIMHRLLRNYVIGNSLYMCNNTTGGYAVFIMLKHDIRLQEDKTIQIVHNVREINIIYNRF